MITLFIIGIIKVCFSFYPLTAHALNETKFPRLANIFLKTPISDYEADQLAKWDVVVLGMQAQDTDPEIFDYLKIQNPDIVILAYVPSAEFPLSRIDILESPNGPWHQLASGLSDSWWLRDQNGIIVSFWAGNQSLNPTNMAPLINNERWNTYFARFLDEKILSTGNWDGIFFDSVWWDAAWVNNGNLDLNNDGQKDSSSMIDAEWQNGMKTIFSYLRDRHGDDYILVGNGGDQYHDYLNGRMFESFPNGWENGWTGQMEKYFSLMNNSQTPRLSIINGDTNNSGTWNDFRDMRFALTSTLLKNGYFSYDWGTADHSQLWWYDEFEVALGSPINEPYNVLNQTLVAGSGLWRRDFQNGTVLVNSTNDSQLLNLYSNYEKIKGGQDPLTNNGAVINQVIIPAQDGIILLHQLVTEQITGASFINGSFARVFNASGENIRNGFFAYKSGYTGGQTIIEQDLNNDGQKEIITADNTRVKIYQANGLLIKSFVPYGEKFTSGINLTAADLNNDGWWEIITVPKANATTHIKIFSADGRLLTPGFFAYNQSFKGGADVAVADLNGDATKEIIIAAGSGGGPHLQIFNKDGRLISPGFFAFNSSDRSGLNLAAGDINNDNHGEIIVSRRKGNAEIQIFNGNGNLLNKWQGSNEAINGTDVAVSDYNQDGYQEIFALGN